jgi:hypothetical protein
MRETASQQYRATFPYPQRKQAPKGAPIGSAATPAVVVTPAESVAPMDVDNQQNDHLPTDEA